jgi:hypothetical protein
MTFKIGLPHVGTDEDNLRGHFVADRGEEPLKRFDRSFFPDPKQTRNVEVDLINQRQVLVAFGVLDLVDSNRVDLPRVRCASPKVTTCSTGVEYLFP